MQHMKGTVAFHTIGCKLNYAETSTFARQFRNHGYSVVDFTDQSDVVLINTCSVTENADREARKLVRQALRRSPNAYVIVAGCYAQLRPEEIASIDGVDLVLGAKEKFQIFDYLAAHSKERYPRVLVSDTEAIDVFDPAFAADPEGRTRAYLKVQDGCDYNCSFCTIPLARGASRSAELDALVRQARVIVESGFREIVLSGVNVGDYGRKHDSSLFDLLKRLIEIDGEYRIRISSIEPNLLTDEIIDLVAGTEKICNHFHIPLQSGSGDILRLMRRRYSTEHYQRLIEMIKLRMPDCGIGVDVIVGFPGETKQHFLETYSFLVNLPVSYFHVFTYSERPDTPASAMRHIVPSDERAERSRMLRILSEKKRRVFYQESLGSIRRVVFEEQQRGEATGFTDNYVRVTVPESSDLRNQVLRVRLQSLADNSVRGTVLDAIQEVPLSRLSLPILHEGY